MTLIHLVRHARHTGADDMLTGRAPGFHLSEGGRAEAEELGRFFAVRGADALYSSPRERAVQTAAAIAAGGGLERVLLSPELDEVDFGDAWTGRRFAELEEREDWRRWNVDRGFARTPGGERLIDLAARIMGLIERLCSQYGNASLVLISHAELIRVAVMQILGVSADGWRRLVVSPASITTLRQGAGGIDLLCFNREIA